MYVCYLSKLTCKIFSELMLCRYYTHFHNASSARYFSLPLRCLFSTDTQIPKSITPPKHLIPHDLRPRIAKWYNKAYLWIYGDTVKKYNLENTCIKMYDICLKEVDYAKFFTVFRLPDTLQSWFFIIQLHLWLCIVRFKQEGENGKLLTKVLITLFWKDVEYRVKMLGGIGTIGQKKSVYELGTQFLGLTLAYDEGIMSTDAKLASAVWRNFFKSDPECVLLVDMLVEYIRRQAQHTESWTPVKVLKGEISWLPFSPTDVRPRRSHITVN